MQFKKSIVLLLFLVLATTAPGHTQNFWSFLKGDRAPAKGRITVLPEAYHIARLDQQGIKEYLARAGTTSEDGILLELPAPDGSLLQFSVWETSMMAPTLQNRYPEIRTYTAVCPTRPGVTAKLDYTTKGFHAMIYDGARTYLIDPYSTLPDGYYLVYYKKDLHPPLDARMICENGETTAELQPKGTQKVDLSEKEPDLLFAQNGTLKRTYELALSCTGEYAEAIDGSNPLLANVFSAMTTTMNRVNGIYERELSVTMVFIANEDQVIYLDPATDPFTQNNNGNGLLIENQTNLDNVIGNNNYDIGHCFSTGGGGVAFLGSVCNSANKAKGVTGLPNPVGDAFDVDYVAHEMGHQFGSNHTFNSCGGFEWGPTAYEPGGGSTIMAYAGICGLYNNIQRHSSDYFHAISLHKITDFLSGNGPWGNGGSCATTATGTQPPDIPVIATTYKIPVQTPFELEAPPAGGISGGAVSYNWEQWDRGDLHEADSGAAWFTGGPSLRSYHPDTSRIRIFPNIDSLVRNQTEFPGEHLAKTARTLTFLLTIRNIHSGWGTFVTSDSVVNVEVVNTNKPFAVTTSDSFWKINTQKTVTWNVAQTDLPPINCSNVNIYLSVDGGYTYPYLLAAGVPNTGSAQVTVPDTTTALARLKVKAVGNIFFDISDENFSIAEDVGIADHFFREHLKISPNPAKDRLRVRNYSGHRLHLILFRITGERIWQGTVTDSRTIGVGNYARGIYLLQIEDPQTGARTNRKIILQ